MSVEKFNSKTKVSHESIPFAQINRNVIQNIDYIEAGFVWVYLMSMPPDWLVIKTQIKKHFKIGDRRIKRIFTYLKDHNLISHEAVRTSDGRRIEYWELKVLNGENFIKNPEKSNKKSTRSKTYRVDNVLSSECSTTKNINNKEDKKTERARSSRFPLSALNDFDLSETTKKLVDKYSINETLVKTKFRNHIESKGKKIFKRADLENWFLSEIQHLSRSKTKQKNEVRSTVPDFEPEKDQKKYTSKDTARTKLKEIREALVYSSHKGTIKT